MYWENELVHTWASAYNKWATPWNLSPTSSSYEEDKLLAFLYFSAILKVKLTKSDIVCLYHMTKGHYNHFNTGLCPTQMVKLHVKCMLCSKLINSQKLLTFSWKLSSKQKIWCIIWMNHVIY